MIQYRKLGGAHYHLIDGRRVRFTRGDVIEVESEIDLTGSLDTWERITPLPLVPEDQETNPLEIVHHGFGRYYVCPRGTDDAVNDKPLSLKEARDLVEDPDAGARKPFAAAAEAVSETPSVSPDGE